MNKKLLVPVISLIFLSAVSYAGDSTYVDTSITSDTILYIPGGVEGSVFGATDSVDYERKLTQNPTAALFKSMLVPGLGQIGNRQYVKAVIIMGLEGWFISSAIKNGKDASDYYDQFSASNDINERNILYDNYLDKKDQRNKFTWFAVIVTFVSMFDAYSDAHLSGFPKDNQAKDSNIDLSVRPTTNNGLYAAVSYSF